MLIRLLSIVFMASITLIAAGCAVNDEVRSGALAEPQADEDGDVQVDFDDCPPAVQATILQHVGNGSISEIELSPANQYEVEAQSDAGEIEFVVDADGTYLGAEEEDDDGDDDHDDDDDDDD